MTTDIDIDPVEASFRAVVGNRLRFAREELCRLKLGEVTQALGYGGPSVLAKFESGSRKSPPRLIHLYRLARFYNVSADFLMGLSDDYIRDGRLARERSVAAWITDVWQQFRARDMAALEALASQNSGLDEVLRGLLCEASRVCESVAAVEAAGGFQGVRKGMPLHRLYVAVQRMGQRMQQAEAALNRCDPRRPVSVAGKAMNESLARLAALEKEALEAKQAYENAVHKEVGALGVYKGYVEVMLDMRKSEQDFAEARDGGEADADT